jgi:hypothetical protein
MLAQRVQHDNRFPNRVPSAGTVERGLLGGRGVTWLKPKGWGEKGSHFDLADTVRQARFVNSLSTIPRTRALAVGLSLITLHLCCCRHGIRISSRALPFLMQFFSIQTNGFGDLLKSLVYYSASAQGCGLCMTAALTTLS